MAAITAMSTAAKGKAPIRNTRFTVTSLLLLFASPSAAIASSRKGLPFALWERKTFRQFVVYHVPN